MTSLKTEGRAPQLEFVKLLLHRIYENRIYCTYFLPSFPP